MLLLAWLVDPSCVLRTQADRQKSVCGYSRKASQTASEKVDEELGPRHYNPRLRFQLTSSLEQAKEH